MTKERVEWHGRAKERRRRRQKHKMRGLRCNFPAEVWGVSPPAGLQTKGYAFQLVYQPNHYIIVCVCLLLTGVKVMTTVENFMKWVYHSTSAQRTNTNLYSEDADNQTEEHFQGLFQALRNHADFPTSNIEFFGGDLRSESLKMSNMMAVPLWQRSGSGRNMWLKSQRKISFFADFSKLPQSDSSLETDH